MTAEQLLCEMKAPQLGYQDHCSGWRKILARRRTRIVQSLPVAAVLIAQKIIVTMKKTTQQVPDVATPTIIAFK